MLTCIGEVSLLCRLVEASLSTGKLMYLFNSDKLLWSTYVASVLLIFLLYYFIKEWQNIMLQYI